VKHQKIEIKNNIIHLDGIAYSRLAFGKMLQVAPSTINYQIYRGKDIQKWYDDQLFRISNGIRNAKEIVWKNPSDERFCGCMVIAKTGLSRHIIYTRLRKWAAGKLTTKQLMDRRYVSLHKKKIVDKPNWHGLSNKKRHCPDVKVGSWERDVLINAGSNGFYSDREGHTVAR